jgi:hypothetical protein
MLPNQLKPLTLLVGKWILRLQLAHGAIYPFFGGVDWRFFPRGVLNHGNDVRESMVNELRCLL